MISDCTNFLELQKIYTFVYSDRRAFNLKCELSDSLHVHRLIFVCVRGLKENDMLVFLFFIFHFDSAARWSFTVSGRSLRRLVGKARRRKIRIRFRRYRRRKQIQRRNCLALRVHWNISIHIKTRKVLIVAFIWTYITMYLCLWTRQTSTLIVTDKISFCRICYSKAELLYCH